MAPPRGEPRCRIASPGRHRHFWCDLMTMVEISDRVPGPVSHCAEPAWLPGLAAPYARSGVFPRRGRTQTARELVGRERDLAVIRAFMDELPAQGEALMVSGEPGVGKSALLDAAEETAAAAGIRVLRAAGAQAEDVSFCGLNQLLLPL